MSKAAESKPGWNLEIHNIEPLKIQPETGKSFTRTVTFQFGEIQKFSRQTEQAGESTINIQKIVFSCKNRRHKHTL